MDGLRLYEISDKLWSIVTCAVPRLKAWPVNPFMIAKSLDIELAWLPLAHSCGRITVQDGTWHIQLSTRAPRSRQRWSCAHELGHYFLHSEFLGGEKLWKELGVSVEGLEEIEELICDMFAQEFLLPSERIYTRIDEPQFGVEEFISMSEEFGCSLQATAIRIARMNKDYAFFLATLNRTNPRKGALSVKWTAQPKSLFLPLKKVIPPNSCVYRAFASNLAASAIEKKILGRLPGPHLVQAVPLQRTSGSLAMVHLISDDRPWQLNLFVLHTERFAYEHQEGHPQSRLNI